MKLRVIDDFLPNPFEYKAAALRLVFGIVPDGEKTFRGIAFSPQDSDLAVAGIHRSFPDAMPVSSFFRKSPAGQIEPNDIHSDAGMGDWTGILYLNEKPDFEDGTVFWRHKETGNTEGEDWKRAGHDRSDWVEVCRVPARFNRLLLFDAKLYHSRAIVENYGEGDDARLIQVIFGKGEIPWQ